VAVKAIAGDLAVNGTRVPGKVRGLSTEPAYLDISVKSEQTLGVAIPDGHNTLVYVYEGELRVAGTDYPLRAGMLGRLSHSGVLELNVSSDTRLLVISGKPIGEPIVHYGPFVMNSVEEIQQAIQDYQSGRLVSQAGA
jgi:redox-sensitive bicupin YhaK (pirin superfamily)